MDSASFSVFISSFALYIGYLRMYLSDWSSNFTPLGSLVVPFEVYEV